MIEKQYVKNKSVCKVTFTLSESIRAEAVCLVGDFNNWSEDSTPLKKLKNGCFTTTLTLEKGRENQFRYLVNGSEWRNDWNADKYVPSRLSGDNSVVVT